MVSGHLMALPPDRTTTSSSFVTRVIEMITILATSSVDTPTASRNAITGVVTVAVHTSALMETLQQVHVMGLPSILMVIIHWVEN